MHTNAVRCIASYQFLWSLSGKAETDHRQRRLLAPRAYSSDIANTSSNSQAQFGNIEQGIYGQVSETCQSILILF